MCMEDVRLARKTSSRTTITTLVAGTNTLLVPQNEDRYSLLIQVPVASGVAIFPASMGPVSGGAALPIMSESYLLIDLQHHGDLVRSPWRAFSFAGTPTIIVTETTLGEQ